MAGEILHPDGRIEHPGVRFEPSDVSFGWIVATMVGAIIVVVILFLLVLAFFHGYRDHLAEINRSPFPLAPGPSMALPRQPRLEQVDRMSGTETANAYQRAAMKLRALNSYGPSEVKGFVRIPIERAMQLIVEKEMLKARPEVPPRERMRSGGLVDAGESNSGRLFKGNGQ